jgi:ribosomal protein L12E/L44/L45/RPP1/RPP2
MAFKLSKVEQETRTILVAALEETGEALKNAVDTFNATITAAWAEVQQRQEQYNKNVEQSQEFIEAVHDDQNDDYEEKSEAWQESDVGQAVYAWLEEWSIDLEPSDLEPPEPITLDDLAGSELEGLPIEPSP